ncbi:rhombotarget A [Acinetobacter sp. ANC 3813]|uniref:rhombotarget A n=1 Tax=Acinetobacter sp. ANC 3813 TaxID=1977873 RepID=UPI000A34E6CD|nr:rhombotarget A [Acinetobacter sp. ANC 3813]OTG91076.1 rhombotarget A [Acinetobacter sp. ANC 3813]
MLKRSIGIGVLCFAGHAYSAEINITTTEDVVKDDKECSLREAVEYLNIDLDDRPDDGYMGCGGKDASSIIALEKNKVYKLVKKLEIKSSMDIKTLYDTNVSETAVAGLNNATIEMTGQEQIFYIDNDDDSTAAVNLKEINLQGCGKNICADKGGIIYNNKALTLDSVKLLGGYARLGGAIYNVGLSSSSTTVASSLKMMNVLVADNQAVDGAAVYAQAPSFKIDNTVFKNNTSTSGQAIVFTLAGSANADKLTFPSRINYIFNSTFFKNKGFAVNLKDGLGVNNLTVMKNTGGVIFDSAFGQAYLANSIVIGNDLAGTLQDCSVADTASDKSILFNNLVSQADCPVGISGNQNTVLQNPKLIAGDDEGVCKTLLDDSNALMCPYSTPSNTFLGYLRPRMLLSYANVFSSPILNKGETTANGNVNFVACELTDQRGTSRLMDNAWCDRGAIEVTVPTSIAKLGKDIKYGEIAQFNILESLGDSDLLPKEQCEAEVGPNPAGTPWQDGCLVIEQKWSASKGKTVLNLNGDLTYTPNGNWHGSDDFNIKIITSSTRFNEQVEAKYISALVTIYQEPNGTMESKTVETSGGALGLFSLMSLLGLIGLRRFK